MNLTAFYYAFAIPISCIIATNVVIFIITIVSIFRRGKGLRSNQKKQKMAMTNLQAAITSFILLGKDNFKTSTTHLNQTAHIDKDSLEIQMLLKMYLNKVKRKSLVKYIRVPILVCFHNNQQGILRERSISQRPLCHTAS